MKHTHEIFGEYIEANREQFETEENGSIITPASEDVKAFKAWCSDFNNSPSSLYGAFLGVSKKEICSYAEAVIRGLANEASDEQIDILRTAVDAFADWQKDWTEEPETVLSYCKALEQLLTHRWRDRSHTIWPCIALHLLFCELGIRAFHRLGAGDAETRLHGLLINSAALFTIHKSDEDKVPGSTFSN